MNKPPNLPPVQQPSPDENPGQNPTPVETTLDDQLAGAFSGYHTFSVYLTDFSAHHYARLRRNGLTVLLAEQLTLQVAQHLLELHYPVFEPDLPEEFTDGNGDDEPDW